MGPRIFPPNVSQELIFQTSTQSDKAIQSYRSANEGCRNGVLIVAGLIFLKCFLRIMNHLFGDPWVSLCLWWLYKPHFRPLKPHFCFWALEIEQRRVRVKVWASVREVWGLKPNSRILLPNKIVKVSKTCKILLKWLFDKLSCVEPVLTIFFPLIRLQNWR